MYKDELTASVIIDQMVKLKKAFPQLPSGFYEILSDRLEENNFTDNRLKDAINNMIDNFTYPIPTVANIISFDKRVKIYSYLDIIEMVNQYGTSVWYQYKPVRKIGNIRYFASLKDIETYNLEVL